MYIKKCDRCGDTYSTEEDITVLLRGDILLRMHLSIVSRKVDLCHTCVSDFVHWWHTVIREGGNK